MKRFLTILIAAVMLVSLAACNGGSDNGPTTTANPTGETKPQATGDQPAEPGTDGSGDLMTPDAPYPETLTITTARYYSPTTTWAPGESMEDNFFTRYLKEKLNVEFKIQWQVEQTEFINKLSLNLASGDIPDTVTLAGGDYLFYKELYNNDLLADLNEAYEKCAGDYMREVFDTYEDSNLAPFREDDGGLYAIASGNYGYGHSLLWVRNDWLKQAGLEVPMTIEEYENVLRVFVTENIGGKGNLGLTLDANNPIGRYASGFSANAIFYALHAYPYQWLVDESGQVYYGSTAPEVKEGLALLARWYQEGLIDKQFMTRTSAGAKEALITSEQTGIWFGWWGFPWSMGDLYKIAPDMDLVAVQAPLDSDGNYSHLWPAPVQNMMVVSKSFSNPEALIKVLNAEYQVWRGFDQEKWEELQLIDPDNEYNSSWADMFPTANLNLEYADIIPSVGALAKEMIEEGTDVGRPSNTQHDRNMATSAMEYSKGEKPDGWADYYTRYIGSNAAAQSGTVVKNAYAYTTDSMADLKPNLDKLELETYLKIIVGEKPVDYFDEFVEQWKAQGGDILTKEVQEMIK